MKIIFLTISILLIAYAHGGILEEEHDILYKFKPQVLVHLVDRRGGFLTETLDDFEKTCPGKRQTLKDAFIAYNNCTASVDDSKTMCSQLGTYLSKCTKPIQEVVDDCVSTKGNEITQFYLQLFSTVLEYVCEQDAETVLELPNPCIIRYEEKKVINAMMKYGGTSKENRDKFYDFMRALTSGRSSPLQICKNVVNSEKYIEPIMKAICKNPKTQNLYIGIYRAGLENPCRSSILK